MLMNGSTEIQDKERSNSLNGYCSLYFHVPFCRHKCDYCHFFVLPDREHWKDDLLQGFRLEWERIQPKLQDRTIVSVYFGGGTPSLFGPERLRRLPLDLKGIEVTLEANPEEITSELMCAYREAGINRVSIGVQSLDDQLLNTLSRRHSAKAAVEAVYRTKEAGIENISIDLMYELPGQSLATWEQTLNRACQLPISHLSLYNLTIEPNTAFFKRQQQLQPLLPDAESARQMYEMAIERLGAAGLKQYEVSAFARDDLISVHNTGYWSGRPFFGLGPSAFSYWDHQRFRNVAHLGKYLSKLQVGESPIDFSEELAPDARRRELLAIGLRLNRGVSLEMFQANYGILDQEVLNQLKDLQRLELVVFEEEGVRLSDKGRLFYDTVAETII